MSGSESCIAELLRELEYDILQSREELLTTINAIKSNAKLMLLNIQTKMDCCLKEIVNDFATIPLPEVDVQIEDVEYITDASLQTYNRLLQDLYNRAQVDYKLLLDKYLEVAKPFELMIRDITKRINLFFGELQRSLQLIAKSKKTRDILQNLRKEEKLQEKRCIKFRSDTKKLFNKLMIKIESDLDEFEEQVHMLIDSITKEQIAILQDNIEIIRIISISKLEHIVSI